MTRSEFDNAYKDFVHNSSAIPKLPWKLKAMNKRESCDMLTDLVMNTYWYEGGMLDQISFIEALLQEFLPVWWDESIWPFRFECCFRNTKMILAGRTTESVCQEMIRLCFQHYNLDITKHIDPDRDIEQENRKLKNPNRSEKGSCARGQRNNASSHSRRDKSSASNDSRRDQSSASNDSRRDQRSILRGCDRVQTRRDQRSVLRGVAGSR